MLPPRPTLIALCCCCFLCLQWLAACEPAAPPPVSPPPKPIALGPIPEPAAADANRPWLLHIPGVSGESIVDHTLVHGLVEGDLHADIQIYDWTEHDGGIPALQATERHKKHARKIAEKLTDQFRAEPTRPIYLTSHSGGVGLAAWALEDLPADVKVDRALFLAPALSQDYDLSKALSHVIDKAYVLYSSADTVVLSVGTKTFGTIDGVYTEAAGVAGFKMPKSAADPTQYRKLIQLPYDADWARFGNFGSHIGSMATPFAAHVLVPLLQGKGPTTAPSTQPVRTRG